MAYVLCAAGVAVFLILFVAAEVLRYNPVGRRALSDRRLRIGRRLEVYVEPRDIWVGAFVGEFAVYVLLLPCLVIRWDRSNQTPPPAEPRVSLMHRTMCADLTKHVAPVGFDASESGWDGVSHGESMLDDAEAFDEQCMCGHPRYFSCPDWIGPAEPTKDCKDGRHRQCSRKGWNDYMGVWQRQMCPCDCHSLPLSEALKAVGHV